MVLGMADMVESRDNNTGGHIKRTSAVVKVFSNRLREYCDKFQVDELFLKQVEKAAPMHDLGKIAIDDAVLRKPGKYTDEEYAEMKRHAAEGARIVENILRGVEDDNFECFLIGNPRAEGHVAISTKKHFKDMMEIDDTTCQDIFVLAKKVMRVLKEVYESESVYLCTMCDGPMNHFHIQLIPRYSFEKRGSKNFVKPRFDYIENKEKLIKLRERLNTKG